jgi:GNAT superfamily N-acetyltransferase
MILDIREARLVDAKALARVEVESWRDTYPTLLPKSYLAKTLRVGRNRAGWRRRLSESGTGESTIVIVPRRAPERVLGDATYGPTRNKALPFVGEVYAIYLLPDYVGQGLGRRLLAAVARRCINGGISSICVEVLERNPNRFFYEAMGAKRAAHKTHWFGGANLPTLVYGWADVSLLVRERAEDTP